MEHTDLRIEVNTILAETLGALVDDGAAIEDLGGLVEELSLKIVEAAANGDDELMSVTMARVQLLGERWRVEATNEMWDAITRIMGAVFAIAREALL